MEKYGVANRDLLESLLQEESSLMTQICQHNSSGIKVGSVDRELPALQQRLAQVRSSINSLEQKTGPS